MAGAFLDRGGRHLGSGQHHPGSGLNEPHREHLGWPGRVTWAATEGHMPPSSGSHDRQTRSGPAGTILDNVRRNLAMGRRHPCLGLKESHRDHLGHPRRVTWDVGEGHVPPGAWSRDRRTRSGPACTIFDRPGTILAWGGPILPRGLISLIGNTWCSPGRSRGWRGWVMQSPGLGSCD